MAIDEAYAQENLVWVVSINEVVNEAGELPTNSKVIAEGGLKTLGRKAEVSQVMIDDTKESWIKGKAEVSIAASILTPSCTYRKILPLGVIAKIGKSDLDTWVNVDPSNSNIVIFANGWPSDVLTDSERIDIEMFEKDVHGPRSHTPFPCRNNLLPINFKSQNPPYGNVTYNASSFPSSTTLNHTKITPGSWGNVGIRILNRAWF